MSDIAIKAERLGKKYLLRHQEQRHRYKALRDVLAEKAKRLVRFGQSKAQANGSREEFWALKDVSLEVKKGEAIGIIGRNGAGKSTLLKLLSRITEPSTGRIELDGRVASLLEVGTGFHPELTGRENIYLNGAILGMGRAEIGRKFDEIVAFAEVERFLDTPVKRFSSGMYMRLAFAVAAHLDAEILVVDEVLAVGDVSFQRKCLAKMDHVARSSGRTGPFVSHNLDALTKLCTSGIVLDAGRCTFTGPVDAAAELYLQHHKSALEFTAEESSQRALKSARLDRGALEKGTLRLEISFACAETVTEPTFGIVIQYAVWNPRIWLKYPFRSRLPSTASS